MTTKASKLSIGVALLISASFFLIPVHATPAECHSDQRQPQNNGGVAFGARTVLGQTFVLSAPGLRVCKVKVTIRKNIAVAEAVTLRLLNAGFAPIAAPVTIAGVDIPVGTSVQLFDLGCGGAPLGGGRYLIELESPKSAAAAYAWRGSGGNPYVQPGNDGKGWRNLNGGNPANWTNQALWDFTFEILVC